MVSTDSAVRRLQWHAKFTADLEQSVALQPHGKCKVSVWIETTISTITSCCKRGHGILTEAQHCSDGAPSVQPRPVALWFLAVSPSEDSIMRTLVWEGFGAVECFLNVPQCHSKSRFLENLPPALGTTATGLHCQQWPLFLKRNSCNLWWFRINRWTCFFVVTFLDG